MDPALRFILRKLPRRRVFWGTMWGWVGASGGGWWVEGSRVGGGCGTPAQRRRQRPGARPWAGTPQAQAQARARVHLPPTPGRSSYKAEPLRCTSSVYLEVSCSLSKASITRTVLPFAPFRSPGPIRPPTPSRPVAMARSAVRFALLALACVMFSGTVRTTTALLIAACGTPLTQAGMAVAGRRSSRAGRTLRAAVPVPPQASRCQSRLPDASTGIT